MTRIGKMNKVEMQRDKPEGGFREKQAWGQWGLGRGYGGGEGELVVRAGEARILSGQVDCANGLVICYA